MMEKYGRSQSKRHETEARGEKGTDNSFREECITAAKG